MSLATATATRKFRIESKTFFLTYAQANDLNLNDLYDHLTALNGGGTPPTYVCVGEELHQDGNRHYHAYVEYPEKVIVRQARFFDFGGIHPNAQSARNKRRVLAYVNAKSQGMLLANFFDQVFWEF